MEEEMSEFLHKQFDGEWLVDHFFGLQNEMSQVTANEIAYYFDKWYNENYEVTDYFVGLLFKDILRYVTDYLEEYPK